MDTHAWIRHSEKASVQPEASCGGVHRCMWRRSSRVYRFLDGMVIISHTHAPEWLAGLGIGVLEQAGTVLGMCVAAEVAPGRNVLLFCDNTGAKNAVIRGYSKNAYARGLASILWSIAAKANVLVWVEYVKSALNHGDPPSRICN